MWSLKPVTPSSQGRGMASPYQVAVGLGTSSPMEAKQGFYLGSTGRWVSLGYISKQTNAEHVH